MTPHDARSNDNRDIAAGDFNQDARAGLQPVSSGVDLYAAPRQIDE